MPIGPDGIYSIRKIKNKRYLVITYRKNQKLIFRDKFQKIKQKDNKIICQCNHKNVSLIRKIFQWTAPKQLGLKPAFGMGCRTNWAYANVAMAKLSKKLNIPVILAQQSAREIQRAGRNFEDVIDAATWASFEANLKIPWGADGDHLKTKEDIKKAYFAGCTYFTYDPSEYIKNRINGKKIEELKLKELEKAFNLSIPSKDRIRLLRFYNGKPFSIPGLEYNFTCDEVLKLAVKYYKAIDWAFELYKETERLKGSNTFDAEVSIDETETETTPLALIFISSELIKRKINFTSIAPRFVGNFEKAIDYYSYVDSKTGKKLKDLKKFEEKLLEINAISKYFNYKISVHSGSDKFSVYPILGKILKNRLHVKTAGTSYLEELRVIALKSPELFKKIYNFSRKQFEKDRASYQLSANLKNIPDISKMSDYEIFKLLESNKGNDNLRQIMHVTYGSVLKSKKFFKACQKVLLKNEKDHFKILSKHLENHIKKLFSTSSSLL